MVFYYGLAEVFYGEEATKYSREGAISLARCSNSRSLAKPRINLWQCSYDIMPSSILET